MVVSLKLDYFHLLLLYQKRLQKQNCQSLKKDEKNDIFDIIYQKECSCVFPLLYKYNNSLFKEGKNEAVEMDEKILGNLEQFLYEDFITSCNKVLVLFISGSGMLKS